MDLPIGLFRSIRMRGAFANAIEGLSKITQRRPIEVVSDAFKIYEWILREQWRGNVIASLSQDAGEARPLQNFIQDKGAAVLYFNANSAESVSKSVKSASASV